MRARFWPDRAWTSLVGPAWPWVAPDDGPAFRQRVRKTLLAYWDDQRLERVPDEFLSESTRSTLTEASDEIDPDTVFGAGYEKIAAATEADADVLWFFDLGAAGWILTLRRLRQRGWLPDGTDLARLADIEEVWRDGPDAAANDIDARLASATGPTPALHLYRVPLRLWHDHEPEQAMRHLDRAVEEMSPRAETEMGIVLPLTYALLYSLSGNTERAAELLAEGPDPDRPSSWVGFRTPEVRYHRARYLWDLREHEEAIGLVGEVVRDDPSYLLRLLTDPAWQKDQLPEAHAQLISAIGDEVDRARDALTRWQQSRPEDEDEDAPGSRTIEQILEAARGEPYPTLVAASLLPEIERWRREQKAVGEEFQGALERLRTFSRSMPEDFPFRAGEGFADRFVGGPDSDMGRIDRLIDDERMTSAARYVEHLVDELPLALRMALVTYAQRMVNTLARSAEVYAGRNEEGDMQRVRRTYHLAQKVLELRDPVRDLPTTVTPELGQQFNRIWRDIRQIEDVWRTLARRAFGQLEIQPPESTQPIERSGWRALPIRVINSAGDPVPGVPVFWRVASGPGQPRQPSEFLTREWALSLQRGIVRLPVAARGEAEGGEIEARLLGSEEAVRLPYRVVEPGGGPAGD